MPGAIVRETQERSVAIEPMGAIHDSLGHDRRSPHAVLISGDQENLAVYEFDGNSSPFDHLAIREQEVIETRLQWPLCMKFLHQFGRRAARGQERQRLTVISPRRNRSGVRDFGNPPHATQPGPLPRDRPMIAIRSESIFGLASNHSSSPIEYSTGIPTSSEGRSSKPK